MKAPLAALLALLLATPPQLASADLPDLGDSAQAGFSTRDEAKVGREGLSWLREQNALLDDAELDDYLTRLASRLAAASPEPGQSYRLFSIDDGMINAFAMPGGYIGINTGLLLAAQSESELASVVAHEMAHVTQHHIARQLEKQGMNTLLAVGGMLAAVLAASAGGGSNAALAAANIGPGLALQNQLAFSRDFEREADRVGMQTLSRAGFDARAMAVFFERLQKVNRVNDNNALAFLRTHPVTSERIAESQSRAANLGVRMPADSIDFQFAREKARIAVSGALDASHFYQDALKEHRFSNEAAQWFGLARTRLALNDPAGAQEALGRAEKLLGTPHPWLAALGAELLLAQKNYAAAAARYHDARLRFPDAPALAYGELDSLIAGGDLARARQLADAASTRRPNDAGLWARLARIHADRDPLRYHFSLGQQFYLEDRPREALEQYQLARATPGEDFYLRSRLDARIRELTPRVDELRKEKPRK